MKLKKDFLGVNGLFFDRDNVNELTNKDIYNIIHNEPCFKVPNSCEASDFLYELNFVLRYFEKNDLDFPFLINLQNPAAVKNWINEQDASYRKNFNNVVKLVQREYSALNEDKKKAVSACYRYHNCLLPVLLFVMGLCSKEEYTSAVLMASGLNPLIFDICELRAKEFRKVIFKDISVIEEFLKNAGG